MGVEGAVTAYTVTSTSQILFRLIAHSRLSVSKKPLHYVLLSNWPLIGLDFGSATVTAAIEVSKAARLTYIMLTLPTRAP